MSHVVSHQASHSTLARTLPEITLGAQAKDARTGIQSETREAIRERSSRRSRLAR
jgi:hypothetical protein